MQSACAHGRDIADGQKSPDSRKRAVEETMEQAGLPAKSRQAHPREISAAERRRAALARALFLKPRMLILHHFTRGLDSPSRAALLNVIADLRDDFGFALLAMTADLAIARHLAPTLHVMNRGAFVHSGAADTLIAGPGHQYTRRLIGAQQVGSPER